MSVEMLGQVAMKKERFEDAWGWFQKLVELRPQEATSWQRYGIAALRSQHWEQAIAGLGKAMEMDPAVGNYRQEIGFALAQLGRLEEAADTFRVILAQPNPAVETRLALAAVRVEMAQQTADRGQPVPAAWLDEAKEQLDIILQQRPEDPQAVDLIQQLRHLRR
jgi:tetratricopeptide (TPR) repeat protein